MFVSDKAYSDEVRRLVESGASLDVAVAFLGTEAVRVFATVRGRPLRIVCNMATGGTNPTAVATLLKRGAEVRALDDLHAKVITDGRSAIVGSANLSGNGLGSPGQDGKWREAGVKVTAHAELRRIRAWFEAIWREARPVRDADLLACQRAWLASLKAHAPVSPDWADTLVWTLHTGLGRGPIYLAFFSEDLSDEGQRALEEERRIWGSAGERLYAYEDWPELPRKPGAIYIDVWFSSGGSNKKKLSVGDVYRWRGEKWFDSKEGAGKGQLVLVTDESIVLGRAWKTHQETLTRFLSKHIDRIFTGANGKTVKAPIIKLADALAWRFVARRADVVKHHPQELRSRRRS